jgi:hypothetical protein
MWRRIAWACLASLLGSAIAADPRARALSYQQIAEQFRGDPNGAVEAMLDLPDADVTRGVQDASRKDSPWTAVQLEAAAIMHTDAGVFLLRQGQKNAWVHIERAVTLLDAAQRDPESAWIAHEWYAAVTLLLKDDARARFLGDRWHQQPWYQATSALQRAREFERKGSGDAFDGFFVAHSDTSVYSPQPYNQAIPYLEQAISAHLWLGAVHLGRINMLQGHDDDARRLFESADSTSHSRTTKYLARLFLGSMDERAAQPAQAEAHYRAALALIPHAQSGLLALASFLARAGRGPEAAALFAAAPPSATPNDAFDPWRVYLYPYPGDEHDPALIFGELHAEVGQ